VQRVRLALCKLAIDAFFTPERLEALRTPGNRKAGTSKSDGGEKAKNGRERPRIFRLRRPKIVSGSLPPCTLVACRFFRGSESGKHLVMQSVLHLEREKEETHVALLKAPSKKPKTTTLQIRLEEEVKLKLENYAEFIDATPSYVMSEALKLLFKKDDEFKHWLDHRPINNNRHEIEGGLFTKTA
jgi:hypothetical protein